jgi:hypothetical protein
MVAFFAQGIERKYRKPAAGGLRNCSDSPVFCGSKKCAQKKEDVNFYMFILGPGPGFQNLILCDILIRRTNPAGG